MATDNSDEKTPITDDQISVSRRAALRRLGGAAAALAIGGVAAACKAGESGGSGSATESTQLRRAAFTQAGPSGSDLDATRTADDKGDNDFPRTADPKGTDADTNFFADGYDADSGSGDLPGTGTDSDPDDAVGSGNDTDASYADSTDGDVSSVADSKVRDGDTSRTADAKGDPDTNTVSDPVGSQS